MEKKRILLAARAPRDFQELRNALLEAGYELRIVDNGAAALTATQDFAPHLILSEIELPKIDGHHLLQELKSHSASSLIPFVLICRHRSVEERVHSINIGVDEYITSPFDVKEMVLRLGNILKEVEKFEKLPKRSQKGFWGKLSELSVCEVVQMLHIGEKSAFVKIQSEYGQEGGLLVRDGELIDAFVQDLDGERALSRMFTWDEGRFQVRMQRISQRRIIKAATEKLIKNGMITKDRWNRVTRTLPNLLTRVKPGPNWDKMRLERDEKPFLKHIRERARLLDMIEESQAGDLQALVTVARMFRSGKIMEVDVTEEIEPTTGFSHFTQNGKTPLSRLVAGFFRQDQTQPQPAVDRRNIQRRQLERRTRNRRRSDAPEEPVVFLNKAELIMIREKLMANGTRAELTNENR